MPVIKTVYVDYIEQENKIQKNSYWLHTLWVASFITKESALEADRFESMYYIIKAKTELDHL